jgi:hypothetical protein
MSSSLSPCVFPRTSRDDFSQVSKYDDNVRTVYSNSHRTFSESGHAEFSTPAGISSYAFSDSVHHRDSEGSYYTAADAAQCEIGHTTTSDGGFGIAADAYPSASSVGLAHDDFLHHPKRKSLPFAQHTPHLPGTLARSPTGFRPLATDTLGSFKRPLGLLQSRTCATSLASLRLCLTLTLRFRRLLPPRHPRNPSCRAYHL